MADLVPALLAFTAAAAVLTITPGLDTALVLRSAAMEGARAAALVALGIVSGCFLWGAFAAFGLGALMAASATAYAWLKLCGGAYLVWLGVRLIVGERRDKAATHSTSPPAIGAAHFRRGFLTNLLNPKVGVFYVSFLPQFIPTGANVSLWTLALTAIHAGLGLVWFGLLIGAARPVAALLRAPHLKATLDRITGCLFVALGARLALETEHD